MKRLNLLQYLRLGYDINNVSGVNCWGLYREVLKNEMGVDLPVLAPNDLEAKGRDSIADAFEAQIPALRPVHVRLESPEPLCLILLTKKVGGRLRYHCGVWYNGQMIHAKGSGRVGSVTIDPLKEYADWNIEFYKYAN